MSYYDIEDDQKAEMIMAEIRSLQNDKEKWEKFYKERIRAVKDDCDGEIARLTMALMGYFQTVPHKVTETQENYALPSGKLVFKKQEPEYERNDEEVIAWLKDHDGSMYVRQKETLDWSGLKGTLSVMGETVADAFGNVIPCIRAVERPDVFKVELKKVKEDSNVQSDSEE